MLTVVSFEMLYIACMLTGGRCLVLTAVNRFGNTCKQWGPRDLVIDSSLLY